jgi:hypothetical protein
MLATVLLAGGAGVHGGFGGHDAARQSMPLSRSIRATTIVDRMAINPAIFAPIALRSSRFVFGLISFL